MVWEWGGRALHDSKHIGAKLEEAEHNTLQCFETGIMKIMSSGYCCYYYISNLYKAKMHSNFDW